MSHTGGAFELQPWSLAKACVGLSAGLQSGQGRIVKCENGNLKALLFPFQKFIKYLNHEFQEN